MAAIKRLLIRHTFSGGWATAFGPFSEVQPDQNGKIAIPFLTDAKNVLYELDGGPRKSPGTTKLNSSQLDVGSKDVLGVFDFWRQGTGGSPTQKRVVHADTKIYKDDADGSFSAIKTGLTAGVIPNYATFDDLLIISATGTDVPFSWDQSTFQNLAGSPPNFSFSVKHKNSLFAAGVVTSPSTLYFCDNLDPENWTTGTSGSIAIDPDDGDMITAIISHRDELIVFKGPYKGSIHRITGSVFGGANSDLARKTFISGVGAVWQNAVFHLGDDVGFWWSDGTLRTLSATAQFGDFREASLTAEIQEWIDEHLNFGVMKTIQTKVDATGRRVYNLLSIDSATTPSVILVFDFRFDPGRWSRLTGYSAKSIELVQDSNKPRLFFGGSDGHIRKFNQVTRTNDSTAIAASVKTPYMNYGLPAHMKTIEVASVGFKPRSTANLVFGWQRDTNAQQTQNFSVSAGFILDTQTLPGVLTSSDFVDYWQQLHTGGDFRHIQYEISNNTDSVDMEVHSFSAMIHPDSESQEN